MTAVQTAGLVLHDAGTARAATDRLRLTLTDAHEQLIDLYTRRAHEALGYGRRLAGWTAYLAAEFGDLLSVVPTPEQLCAMVDAGMSQREAAAPFKASVGTVNAALAARRAPTPPPAPAAPTSGAAKVRAALAAAGATGATSPELERRLKLHHGIVSGELSRLARTGRAATPTATRGGHAVYVMAH